MANDENVENIPPDEQDRALRRFIDTQHFRQCVDRFRQAIETMQRDARAMDTMHDVDIESLPFHALMTATDANVNGYIAYQGSPRPRHHGGLVSAVMPPVEDPLRDIQAPPPQARLTGFRQLFPETDEDIDRIQEEIMGNHREFEAARARRLERERAVLERHMANVPSSHQASAIEISDDESEAHDRTTTFGHTRTSSNIEAVVNLTQPAASIFQTENAGPVRSPIGGSRFSGRSLQPDTPSFTPSWSFSSATNSGGGRDNGVAGSGGPAEPEATREDAQPVAAVALAQRPTVAPSRRITASGTRSQHRPLPNQSVGEPSRRRTEPVAAEGTQSTQSTSPSSKRPSSTAVDPWVDLANKRNKRSDEGGV